MTPIYNDEGMEIDPYEIIKPNLCVICKKDSDSDEELLCNLIRFDQRLEEDFICYAFEKI